MSYRPFVPFKTANQGKPSAIIAIPAIVQEYPAQVIATELRHSATVTAEKVGAAETVANNRRTIATRNADKTGTVATIATVARRQTDNALSQGSANSARFFLDRAIPPDKAQGLAWLLDSLPHNPNLSPAQRAQAEMALHWLADEEYQQRCYILFN